MGPHNYAGEGVRAPRSSPNSGPSSAALWPVRAAASQQEGRATVGLLNIICSPYLFSSLQAFNLTPCAWFVLLPAPCFPFLKTSLFFFLPEGNLLRPCVDARAGTVHSPHSPQPWQSVCEPGHRCWPCLGDGGQVPGSREGALAAPAVCWRGSGLVFSPLLCWRSASSWGEPQLYLPCRASFSSSSHASHQPCWRGTRVAGRLRPHSPAESDLSADIAGRNKAVFLSTHKQQVREDDKARLPSQQGTSLTPLHHPGAGSCALWDEQETCLFSCGV